MNKRKITTIVFLHLILIIYSISGILSKSAANVPFLGPEFCLYYLEIMLILGVYAVVWQQIIKRMPLTVAFANKAITVIWGIVWGIVFFNETVTILQAIGACVIIAGIVIYSTDKETVKE